MEIVAPYGGKLKKTGPRQVTISVKDMTNVDVVIDNVEVNLEDSEASCTY